TGDRFMSLCKSGQIINCCHPNALMTLSEYLEDYASPETKAVGYKMVETELEKITNFKVKDIAIQNITDIRASNRRDFRF
ncbi:MAG: [FeFe] hydrogenase H-cluster radical SAM maturase HydG, partial [Clostridia bacterium]|nr:[FeFe] hydrogenase H-cluster radical SAM maturase HydG [Clostridia bacterium]